VGGRVSGFGLHAPAAFHERDGVACALQQIRRGDARDAGADDKHIDGDVFF
jgi:hypothetical protein